MTLLFSIHASPSPKGFGKPSVHAVPPAGLVGVYDEVTGEVWTPDANAIREALPHQWRKAWDRASGSFWYDKNGRMTPEGLKGSTPYKTIYRADGSRLATIYALPYHFGQKV